MPNPKRRHSKARRDRRRTHDSLEVMSASTCPNCQTPKLPHRVCPSCGFYRGKLAVRVAETV
ncbi:MAG: 50S ribosomal protein L32 [Holophagaceae bacterium]|jgi:large subunit ribosomal protein L32|uniref:Large ribosomal subunit protein bL32 n=1 Tax=Candidatus Geothrix skivensis TaxID=2954439 RepID=A0A9D7SFL5_9BACT|nr:50S ribosomal protein L32 [Candidatus Geothrix skivensis]